MWIASSTAHWNKKPAKNLIKPQKNTRVGFLKTGFSNPDSLGPAAAAERVLVSMMACWCAPSSKDGWGLFSPVGHDYVLRVHVVSDVNNIIATCIKLPNVISRLYWWKVVTRFTGSGDTGEKLVSHMNTVPWINITAAKCY